MPNTLSDEYLQTSSYKPGIFNGKVAFVTGGAGTICRVQTEALVLLGANAVVLGRNVKKTEDAAKEIATLRSGAKVLGIGNVDVRDIQSLHKAVETTVKELGRIDFVIAGAAGNFISPFTNTSARAFKSVVDIDLIGSFNTAKATFEELRKNKGQILFVTALLQKRGLPLQVHATAAKNGVDALLRSIAVELGPLGVRSNGIAPGAIEGTEGMARLLPENLVKRSKELVPLGRWGTTRDIADGTVFLFSDAARYITGHILEIDGAQWHTGSADQEMYPASVRMLNENTNKL